MKFSSNKKYKFLQKVYSTSIPSNIRKLVNSSIYTIHHHLFRPTHSLKKKKKEYQIRQKRSTQFWYSPLAFRKRRVKSYHEGTIARSQPSESYSSRGGKGGEGKATSCYPFPRTRAMVGKRVIGWPWARGHPSRRMSGC